MLARAFSVSALILALASPAWAGSKAIVSPGLPPPLNGLLGCTLVNASFNESLPVDLWILSSTSTSVRHLGNVTVGTLSSWTWESTNDAANFCVVRILSGSSKDARLSALAKDAGGELIGAVYAPYK
jgi:hypothetical protein